MRYLGPFQAASPQRESNNTTLLAAGCSYCPSSQATPADFFDVGVYLFSSFYSSCSKGICDWGVGGLPFSPLCFPIRFPDMGEKGVIFGVGGLQIPAGNI